LFLIFLGIKLKYFLFKIIIFRMKNNKTITLTVSWHSFLISFVQRYVNTLNIEQKKELIGLAKVLLIYDN
jgi:hypothetical protein